jgi:hypothetical protein
MAAQRKALTREPVIGQNLFNPVTLWRQGRGIISQPTGRQRQKNYSGDEQPPQLNQAARAVIIAVLAPATHVFAPFSAGWERAVRLAAACQVMYMLIPMDRQYAGAHADGNPRLWIVANG